MGAGLAACALLFAQQTPVDWNDAERKIVRLAPAKFERLPDSIRRELQDRGCTIPQTWDDATPHNVVSGHFTSTATNDWAVLCSVKGKSSILVFRGGVEQPVARLAGSRDFGFLQITITGQPGYSRKITAIAPDEIRHDCKLWGQKCPPITHEGIEDSFEGKASTIRYRHRGNWTELAGAD